MMAQLVRPLVIVALYALLLPVAGPMLDHHYVEWQHGHGHAYLGGVPDKGTGFHVHIYDTYDSHDHLSLGDAGGDLPQTDGVAFFTRYDGAGMGAIYSVTGPATVSMLFPDPEDSPLLVYFVPTSVTPVGALTVPPRKPPTA